MAKGVKRINPPGMKFCPACEQTKPVTEFGKATRSHDGLFTYCKACTAARNRARTSEMRRRWHLSNTYGLSLDQYEAMLTAQGGVSAICKQPPSTGKKRRSDFLVVDHDHSTGAIRALLCHRCNNLLSSVQDSSLLLETAIAYLNSHRGN